MKKIDARSLCREAQQQLRNQAIRLKKSGRTNDEIAEIVGVHRSTICEWWKLYKRDGAAGIKLKKRGTKPGERRTLTADQEYELQRMLIDKTPDQLKMPFALWTRKAVQELIDHLWSIKMPIRTVGEYLKRWGFTPQKPLRRAYEQNIHAVARWLVDTYPAIAKQAKKEKAEIHWGDETGLRSDCQHGRGYSPKGQTPVMRLKAKWERLNLISTVTNQGKVRFMTYEGKMNGQMLIRFMKRLIKDADRKVFLILDNLRVHHGKIVKRWLEKHSDQIVVFHLPSYSPELNPDEYLNCDLKNGVHSGTPIRKKGDLKKKAVSHLRMLQKQPDRVMSYFDHPKICYAA